MIIKVIYKNIEWADRRCIHVSQPPAEKRSRALRRWEAIKGTEVIVDTETFKAGECSNCDSWLIQGESRKCVIRGEVEIGD